MDLDTFKSRIDIVKIIELFLPLKKQGQFYKANCPFHNEKTPSFIVNDNKGYWHCFGCNKGGDAIKFIQEYKKLSFTEAMQEIAKIENIELDTVINQKAKKEFEFLQDLHCYFKKNLTEEAKSYFLKRGLNENDIYEFELGYTGNIENFLNFLNAKDYYLIAKKMGYIKEAKNGYFSMFCNRLSFTIKDNMGRVRGFSTRELRKNPYANFGKYVNSLNSDFFNKSFLLFNFDKAKEYARITKKIILCEGFFDAIALHKAGFKEVVATCGTAFTLYHLSMIKRLNIENIKLIFIPDKDEAGYESVARALWICFENELFNTEVGVINKNVKDSGEFMQKFKEEALKQHLHYYTGLEFYIKHRLKGKNDNEKFKLFQSFKKLLNKLDNFYLKASIIKEASEYFNINEKEFLKQGKEMKKEEKKEELSLTMIKVFKTALEKEEFKEKLFFYVNELMGNLELQILEQELEIHKTFIISSESGIYTEKFYKKGILNFVFSRLYQRLEKAYGEEAEQLSYRIAQLKEELKGQ